MSFRGIDPVGLAGLAHESSSLTARARTGTAAALRILDTHGYTTQFGALGTHVATWGENAERNLLWRSRAIAEGQATGWNPGALLQAAFAADAIFQLHNVDQAFEGWLAEEESSRERVDAAVADIGWWLDQTWTDWDVTNNDLHQIHRALGSLSPAELDRVVRRLSPSQLRRWIAEMGHSFNGFSRDEKAEVFHLLAGNASGDVLGAVHDAILSAGSVDDLLLLGEAIAMAAPGSPIVEFVAWAARSGIADTRFSGLAPAIAITGIDDEAAATAVLSLLDEDALPGLLVDCLLYDEARYESLVTALSRSASADGRAAAFLTTVSLAGGGTSLNDLIVARSPQRTHDQEGDRHASTYLVDGVAADLLDAATQFLLADPEGAIQSLATERDTEGTAMTHYWYLLYQADRSDDFAAIVSAVRGGDEIAMVDFTRRGDDPGYSYPHARNLAFTAATLNMGLENAAENAADDIDRVVTVAGFATSVLGLLNKGSEVVATLIGTGAEFSLDHLGERTKEEISDQLSDLINQVSGSLRPDKGDGAGAALDAWIDVYSAIHPGI